MGFFHVNCRAEKNFISFTVTWKSALYHFKFIFKLKPFSNIVKSNLENKNGRGHASYIFVLIRNAPVYILNLEFQAQNLCRIQFPRGLLSLLILVAQWFQFWKPFFHSI